MHSKEAIYFTFNKFFYDFLDDIKNSNKEVGVLVKAGYKVKNMQSEKNLDDFVAHNKDEQFKEVVGTESDDIVVNVSLKDMVLAKAITMDTLASRLDKDCHTTIACYVYHFTLMKLLLDFAKKEEDESNVKALFNQVMQILKHIQNKDDYSDSLDDIFDDDIKALLIHIDKTAVAVTDSADAETHTDMSSLPDIENTKIGSMAKEISQELNLGEMNIDKPDDIFKLMQGEALGNIIGKVGSKINQKISSGELKHEELVSEAFSMMASMAGNSNPLLANLMKNMGGMGGMKDMMKNMKVDESKLRSMGTKERLKKKLDERKGGK
jgi:hypothetical protein